MKHHSINLTKEEKENILDQHKEIYDGFVTQYVSKNTQPLYTQDFANDKNGITVSNKGVVMTYRNMNINEDVFSGSHGFEPDNVQYEDKEIGEMHDMIGDSPDDLKHGTFDDDEEKCQHCGGLGHDEFDEEECEWCMGTGINIEKVSFDDEDDDDPEFNNFDSDIEDFNIEDVEIFKEDVNNKLKMFRRIKNH